MPVAALEIQRRGELPTLERQQHLDDARDTGRRRRVADVRLDRADGAELLSGRVPGEGSGERLPLDRVSELGARAVGFDQLDFLRMDAEGLIHLPLQPLLRKGARGRNPVRCPVLIDPGAAHDSVDVVAVAQRIPEAPQHHDTHTLAGHESVGAIVEGVAPPG